MHDICYDSDCPEQKAEDDLAGYEVPGADREALMKRLGCLCASHKVEAAAHEAANTALPRMKDRFCRGAPRCPVCCWDA